MDTQELSKKNPGDTKDLPDWLKKLATESWQAELLISGIAIVGTSQLVGLLEPLSEWALFNVRFDIIEYLRWAILYLGIGFLSLPSIFVIHFCLRAFWIGLIGLSSVFPHGIGPLRPSTITDEFIEEVKRDYPSLPDLIDKLERASSVLFSLAALCAMIFTSIAISLLIVLVISFAIIKLSNGAINFTMAFWGILSIPLAAWLISAAIIATPLKNKPSFKRFYLKFSRIQRKSTMTIFEFPVTYIQTVLLTNVKGKSFIGPVIFGYILLVGGTVYLMTQPFTKQISKLENISTNGLRTDRHIASRYKDELPENIHPIHPYVDTELVEENQELIVYVPTLGEDDYQIEMLTPEINRPDNIDDESWTIQERTHKLNVYQQYYRIRLDETVLTPLQFVWHKPKGMYDGARLVVKLPASIPSLPMLYLDVFTDGKFTPRAVVPLRNKHAN